MRRIKCTGYLFGVLLLANLREKTQEDQLDYLDDKVLVDERVREQVQRILDVASHGRNVTCRKVLSTLR